MTNIVKNSDKEKYMYSGYGIAFDGKSSWSFDNEFARNVAIFGADDNLSSHNDNQKNDFLALGEGDTISINGNSGAPEKKFSINFSKTNPKFCLSSHYNGDNSYSFVKGEKIYKIKANKKHVNFEILFGKYI